MAFFIDLPEVSPQALHVEAHKLLEACRWIIEAYEASDAEIPDGHDLDTAFCIAREAVDRLKAA